MMTFSIYDLLKFIVPPITFIVACLVGVPYVKSRPASYQASAKIWIQAQFPSSGGESNSQNSGLYLPLATFFNSPIKTAAELIRSDVVLDQSVDFLKKSMPDEGSAPTLDELREGVKTEEVKDTDVLIVRYTDRDPKRAFLVLEGVLEGFLKLNSIQSSASALRSRQFLEQQLAVARKDLVAARDGLRRFQTHHGKTDLPQETITTINKMAQMELKVEETRSEIARYRQMVAYLESIPPEERAMVSSASIADDPVIKGLQTRQAEIQLELTQLSPRLKDGHPMIVSLKSASEQLSTAIENRLKAYRNGGSPSDITPMPKSAGLAASTMETESARSLVTSRKELSGLESVLRSRIADVAELKAKIKQLPEQHTQFAELKHNEEHAQSMMSEIENRLDSARQIESVASGVTNIQIIDRPRIPTVPAGPGSSILYAATALLGLGLGTGTFFLIQLLDPSVSRARQIAYPNFPIIAAMGSLKAAHSQKQSNSAEFDRLRLALTPKLTSVKLIEVLSSKPYEGKTITVAGLAKSFAAAGQHALIVEDVSQGPYIHESLGIQAPLSPTHFKEKGLEGIVQEVSPRVSLISTASEDFAWDSETGATLIAELEKHFDVVLFDTDPLSRSAKSLSLVRYKTLPLLLVRMKRTSKAAISVLVRQLSLQGVRSGVIAVWDANQEAIVDAASMMQAPRPSEATNRTEEEDVWV